MLEVKAVLQLGTAATFAQILQLTYIHKLTKTFQVKEIPPFCLAAELVNFRTLVKLILL